MKPTSKWVRLFPIFIILLFTWGRFPSWALPELNPDEGFWIILGAQLYEKFLPYISIDPITGGPVIPALLTLLPALGISLNYSSIRILLLFLCILPSILLLYAGLKRRLGNQAAQFGIIFSATLFAFPEHCWDFIPYNGEYVTLPALSLIYYLHCTYSINNKKIKVLQGILIASTIWIKIQCLPVVFILALMAVFDNPQEQFTLLSKKILLRIAWLGGGILSGISLLAIYFLLYPDAFHNYWVSAFQGNMIYVQYGLEGSVRSVSERLFVIPDLIRSSNMNVLRIACYAHLFLFAVIAVIAIIKRSLPSGQFFWTFLLFIFTCISVSTPGNLFHHYLILFLPATIIMMAEIYAYLKENDLRIPAMALSGLALIFLGWHIFHTMWHVRLIISQPAYNDNSKYYHDKPLTDLIRLYTKPNDKIKIWGWGYNNIYVESERVPSGAPDIFRLAIPSSVQNHHLDNYLIELKTDPPMLFIDAVTTESFLINDPEKQGVKYFPSIYSYIRSNYTLVSVINGKSIYKRN